MLTYIGNTEIIQLLLRNYKVRDSQACIEYNKTSGVWIGEWHWNNRVQKVDTELACDPMNRNSTPLSAPSTKPSTMCLNMCPSSSQRESSSLCSVFEENNCTIIQIRTNHLVRL